LFNVDGTAIPDPLNVSFGPPGTGANSSDLPFDDASRWLVDLDAAIAAGMAVKIPLPSLNFNVDQLFVLGVGARLAPANAAARLQQTLVAHQYTNGLGFLPPGSPTNNTPSVKSSWQSAPQPPSPTDVAAARTAYNPGSNQNAARIAKALGIDGSESLSVAPHGLDDQETPVALFQAQLWPALGGRTLSKLHTTWDIPAGQPASSAGWVLHDDPTGTAALADQANGWVRSRGNLPVMRISNQPYGLLPASSLADWATDPTDPTNQLIQWLRVFRQYWLAGLMNVPAVTNGDPQPDTTIVNLLSRQPVSESLMIRQDGDPVSQEVANQPFPVAPIPGLPMSSELFLSTPAATAIPSPVPFVANASGDQGLLVFYRDLFKDCLALITGTMSQEDWTTKYQPLLTSNNIPNAPPADLFNSIIKDSWVSEIVFGIVLGANSGLIAIHVETVDNIALSDGLPCSACVCVVIRASGQGKRVLLPQLSDEVITAAFVKLAFDAIAEKRAECLSVSNAFREPSGDANAAGDQVDGKRVGVSVRFVSGAEHGCRGSMVQ